MNRRLYETYNNNFTQKYMTDTQIQCKRNVKDSEINKRENRLGNRRGSGIHRASETLNSKIRGNEKNNTKKIYKNLRWNTTNLGHFIQSIFEAYKSTDRTISKF